MANSQQNADIEIEERGRGATPIERKKTQGKGKTRDTSTTKGKRDQIITNMVIWLNP